MQSFDGYTVYKMNANMGMEEQILAEGCRKGDDVARRELYDRYAGRLLAVCLRYSGDRSTAEDLMHDAFLKIYGAFDRFSYRGPGSLRAWMELSMTALDEGRQLPDIPEPDPSELARVPRDVLMGFVSELPDGYRTVFNLYCIEGYSHRDIAQMLGINEKSSSSQLFRARALLARRIGAYMETH